MRHLQILHYVTQWLWLTDRFVYGPISASRHDTMIVSRGEICNEKIFPHPFVISLAHWAGPTPTEGTETAQAMIRMIGQARPDVVHLHHGYGLPDAAAIAARLEVPLVVSLWGYDATVLLRSDPERCSVLLRTADRVLVPSQFFARITEALGISNDRIRVIPGGVDTSYFSPTPVPVPPRVAFIGRFVEKKGIDVLLEAWPHVRAAVPGARLTMLGYGAPAPTASRDLGIRVLAPDPLRAQAQCRSLIRRSRLYVSPSRTASNGDSESQHIGNVEAQASGRPVVTTAHGPIPEFVRHNETGLVVPENDAESLSAAITVLLTDHARCQQFGLNAQRWAKSFDVRRVSRLHDELYEDVDGG
jgi:colanic acid/amylovoran biosynthesis glycosyltransferase